VATTSQLPSSLRINEKIKPLPVNIDGNGMTIYKEESYYLTLSLCYLTLSVFNEHQVINVQVPFLFKLAVDWLAALAGTEASLASFTDANATMLALFASPAAVLIGYGIARSGASACTGNTYLLQNFRIDSLVFQKSSETPFVIMGICNIFTLFRSLCYDLFIIVNSLFPELRNALFSKVTLRATRSVCRMVNCEPFFHFHVPLLCAVVRSFLVSSCYLDVLMHIYFEKDFRDMCCYSSPIYLYP
jgi:hypothetical protein